MCGESSHKAIPRRPVFSISKWFDHVTDRQNLRFMNVRSLYILIACYEVAKESDQKSIIILRTSAQFISFSEAIRRIIVYNLITAVCGFRYTGETNKAVSWKWIQKLIIDYSIQCKIYLLFKEVRIMYSKQLSDSVNPVLNLAGSMCKDI